MNGINKEDYWSSEWLYQLKEHLPFFAASILIHPNILDNDLWVGKLMNDNHHKLAGQNCPEKHDMT
ncbi:hypothetical protein OAJ00_02900 [Paracoccaceae bacterium]|nr:hypothetical protein [Paracoccaceae bacterium]